MLSAEASQSDTDFVLLHEDQVGRSDVATLDWGRHDDPGVAVSVSTAETERLATLYSYRVLDSAPEPGFDELAQLAAALCRAPIALIGLVDQERVWFKARSGLDLSWVDRQLSFCAHALTMTVPLVVPDALADSRFDANPLVTGPPGLRAYAGAPLVAPNGTVLGTLCVIDTTPRSFEARQIAHLESLARQVMALLELRRVSARLAGEVVSRREAEAALTTGEAILAESEQRWRSLFEASPVAIALTDDSGSCVAVNEALCELLGRDESEILGRRIAEFVHHEDLARCAGTGEAIAAAPDGVVQIEKRLVRPDGQVRWAWVTLTHVPGPLRARWTLAQLLDVTDRNAQERALHESEANLFAVTEVVNDIQRGPDARQTIVEACRRLAGASHVTLMEPNDDRTAIEVTAASDPRFENTSVAMSATSATVDSFLTGVANFLPDADSDPRVPPELLAISKAHSLYIVPVVSGSTVVGVLSVDWTERVPDLDDRRVALVTLLADHAAVALRQAALISELEGIAHTDQLTGLPNRRSWDHLLELHMALALKVGQPLTVAIVDIDHFKTYNDTPGHLAGDDLLRSFAVLGAKATRKGDTLSRWGGEEFAIVLPDCDPSKAPSVLDRVRAAVPDGQTASIGFATWDQSETAEELVARADQAMYQAKANGRNRTVGSATRRRRRP